MPEVKHAKTDNLLKTCWRLINKQIKKCSYLSVTRKVPLKEESTLHILLIKLSTECNMLVGSGTRYNRWECRENIESPWSTCNYVFRLNICTYIWIYGPWYDTATLFLNAHPTEIPKVIISTLIPCRVAYSNRSLGAAWMSPCEKGCSLWNVVEDQKQQITCLLGNEHMASHCASPN